MLLHLLLWLIVLCIVFGVLYKIITLLPLPAPFGTIALLLLLLVFVLIIFETAIGIAPIWHIAPGRM